MSATISRTGIAREVATSVQRCVRSMNSLTDAEDAGEDERFARSVYLCDEHFVQVLAAEAGLDITFDRSPRIGWHATVTSADGTVLDTIS